MPSPLTSASGHEDRTSARRSIAYAVLNSLFVTVFALFHRYLPPADLQSQLSYQSYVCLISAESLVLFSPAIVLAWLGLTRRYGRIAGRISVVLTLLITGLYFVDFAIVNLIREHLFSKVFWSLIATLLPYIDSYIRPVHLFTVGGFFAGWCFVQAVLWAIAGRLAATGRLPDQEREKPLGWVRLCLLGGVAIVPLGIAFTPIVEHWSRTKDEIASVTRRHPINLLAFNRANNVPVFREHSSASQAGRAFLLSRYGEVDAFTDGYRKIKYLPALAEAVGEGDDRDAGKGTADASGGVESQARPDVLVVFAECFRPDVISQATTPYLRRQAESGLWAQNHFSAGNASCYGFFGAMFGVDAIWFNQASALPVGMCAAMRDLGYEVGFFGRDDFNNFGMETFCAPERFDYSSFRPQTNSTECDARAADDARDFLNRRGAYRSDDSKPRMAFLYFFAPHQGFHEPLDAAATVVAANDERFSRVVDAAKFTNFLRSAHFVDRTVESVRTDDCVTFVLGDHGESFGEDGRMFHGTALSEVQVRTTFLAFGPGVPRKHVTRPTSHCDLLPTLLDVLDARASDPELLDGQSILSATTTDRVLLCRGMGNFDHLFVDPGYRVGDRALGYQGFFDWSHPILSSGSYIDSKGDAIDVAAAGDSSGTPMSVWLADRFQFDSESIANHGIESLEETVSDESPWVRLKSIDYIGELGVKMLEFEDCIRGRLSDSDSQVRTRAFQLMQRIGRYKDAHE